ncbi:GNAT family N-acetyltransferase [Pseudogracilibacillus sp. ICA-222130]|uniref:GNAT family N-acetyltransferase n=1 Tax=Pseudogracilibacillus sp. ICA-222130 TaxID=3134655 RepID=UPI0030BFB436
MEVATVADAKDVHAIMTAAFSRYKHDPFPTSALQETVASVRKDLQNGELAFFYVEKNERVGMVRCVLKKDYLYFRRLSVLPKMQGKGIAKKILAFLEKEAKRLHLPAIRCKVRKSEPKNIALYESVGYVIIGEEDVEKEHGALPIVVMEKQLN